MITLYKFLSLMDLDSELEIFDDNSPKLLIEGRRGTIDLPFELYDVEVTRFIPGIVTMIFIKEPKY